MKITFDKSRDLLYIWMGEKQKAAKTETVSPGVHADFSSDGTLIGIEVIDAHELLDEKIELDLDLAAIDLRKSA